MNIQKLKGKQQSLSREISWNFSQRELRFLEMAGKFFQKWVVFWGFFFVCVYNPKHPKPFKVTAGFVVF